MAVIGIELPQDTLVLTQNRDFRWSFENQDENGVPTNFPAGDLFLEFQIADGVDPVTVWSFDITGSVASIHVEHTDANAMPARTVWQLVFLPDGEAAGGDPIGTGTVRRQGATR